MSFQHNICPLLKGNAWAKTEELKSKGRCNTTQNLGSLQPTDGEGNEPKIVTISNMRHTLTIFISHGWTVYSFATSHTLKTLFVPFLSTTKNLFSKVHSLSTSSTLGICLPQIQWGLPVTWTQIIHPLYDVDLTKTNKISIRIINHGNPLLL